MIVHEFKKTGKQQIPNIMNYKEEMIINPADIGEKKI